MLVAPLALSLPPQYSGRRDRSDLPHCGTVAAALVAAKNAQGMLAEGAMRSGDRAPPYLFLGQVWAHACIFDPIPALDHVGLERYRARPVVQLEKQAAGIAENRPELISSPERSSRGAAIVAGGLRGFAIVVSGSRHHNEG